MLGCRPCERSSGDGHSGEVEPDGERLRSGRALGGVAGLRHDDPAGSEGALVAEAAREGTRRYKSPRSPLSRTSYGRARLIVWRRRGHSTRGPADGRGRAHGGHGRGHDEHGRLQWRSGREERTSPSSPTRRPSIALTLQRMGEDRALRRSFRTPSSVPTPTGPCALNADIRFLGVHGSHPDAGLTTPNTAEAPRRIGARGGGPTAFRGCRPYQAGRGGPGADSAAPEG